MEVNAIEMDKQLEQFDQELFGLQDSRAAKEAHNGAPRRFLLCIGAL